MQPYSTDDFLGTFAFKRCALDVLVALMALFLVFAVSPAGLRGIDPSQLQSHEIVRFLVIAVLPSVLVGLILAHAAKRKGLAMLLAKTAVSIVVSFILFLALEESRRPESFGEMEIIWALGLFALLSFGCDAILNALSFLVAESKRVLVVGNGELAMQMEQLIKKHPGSYELVGSVDIPLGGQESNALNSQTIFEEAKRLGANKIVISLAERRGIFPVQDLLSCKLSGIEVLDPPAMFEMATGKLLIENITPSWFIFCSGFRVTTLLKVSKRVVDIVMSLIGLIVVAPFAPLVALAIKLDSPGPIFFRQIRVGQGDKPFELMKFRTMRQDAEAKTGAVWSQQNDTRITRLGRFLRKSRIDELPQLLNVLKGEMSLVGPRPERPEFVQKLKEIIPYYSERHYVKPGVSGWAQVCYPYGASVEDAVEKLRYDLYYIKNISLFLDFKIILKTIVVMLWCKGGR